MRLLRRKLWREIRQAKFRFLAVSLVVAIGIVLFTAAYMSFLNLSKSYDYTYRKLNFEDLLVRTGRAPETVVARLSSLGNVRELTPRVSEVQSLELEDGTRITGQVISVPTSEPYVNMLHLRQGRMLTGEEKEFACLVEHHFASFNKLREGDLIYAVENGRRIPVRVAGVVNSPEYLIVFRSRQFPMTSPTAHGIFYFTLPQARALLGTGARSYNEFAFTLKDYSRLEATLDQVKEILSPFGIEEVTTRDNQVSKTLLEMSLSQFRNFALFFPVLFFTIAAFSIYMILSRMVRMQRPIIGLMRAIGYPARLIMAHYISFALLVSAVGIVLGSLLGILATYIVTRIYSSVMGVPFMYFGLYPQAFLYGALMAAFFCTLAGVVPARRSAAVQPTEAMRGAVDPAWYGKRTWLERLLPSFSRVKVFWRLPLRNVFRNRRRTAFTVVGIVFAVVLIMLNLGLDDSVRDNMNRAFNHLYTFDIAALFLEPQTAVSQRKVEDIPGVVGVEPTVGWPCVIACGDREAEGMLMGERADTVMRGFLDEKGRAVRLSPGRCLVSRTFRDKLGLREGDTVTVRSGRRSREFVVSDFIMEPLGSVIHVTLEEARELLGYGTRSMGYYVKLDPAHYREVREALYAIPNVMALVDLNQIRKEINSYLGLMYLLITVMLVFGIIMASTLVFNTSTINIMEREQEVATMLTLGVPQWKASLSITLENVIMGLLGLFPGYVAAHVVMDQAVRLYRTDLFSFTTAVAPRTYLIVAVAVVVIMVFSEYPSLRYIRKLDLAQSTKRRSL